MHTKLTTNWCAAILVAQMIILPTIVSANPAFIIFGDSLSDGGNFFVNSGEFTTQPFDLVPAAPYAVGGFHFTNGSTWIEQLATTMHDQPSAHPALRAPGHFTNYAYGRARSRAGASTFPLFDLSTQVGLFLSDFGGNAPDDTTYVVWTGANDLQDALGALAVDPSGATSFGIIQAAITATANNIMALWGSGARTFLVPNAPNIGITPAVKAAGVQAEMAALQLSMGYNLGLMQALDGLEMLPGIKIVRLDVFTILTDLVADPEAAGFTNVTDSCITPNVIKQALCRRPNQFLFWDGIHPTRAGHRYLAMFAAEELNAN
jgi:phospholipase/lecithinase/hemolysin